MSEKNLSDQRPQSMYQCVSRPGNCKFEWCCGPECSCVIHTPTGGDKEKRDIKQAKKLQAAWRKSQGLKA